MPTYATPGHDWRHLRLPGIVAKTGAYTLTADDDIILCDSSGGAFTITLPPSSAVPGKAFQLWKTNAEQNAVTIDAVGAETINGLTTFLLTGGHDRVYVVAKEDGAGWLAASASRPNLWPFCVTGFGTNLTTTPSQMDLSTIAAGCDNPSFYSLSSDVVTVSLSGVYLVSHNVDATIDSDTGAVRGRLQSYIWRNGSSSIGQTACNVYIRELGDATGSSSCAAVNLNASDTLEIYAHLSQAVDASLLRSQLTLLYCGPEVI